jgi:Uncharacterised nucleotidyltransferase
MNRQLAQAVIATFREADPESHFRRLSGFRYRSWVGIYDWLDASGLALYFLARVQALGVEAAIPVRVLQRLEGNTVDNVKKTTSMFQEFMTLNQDFQHADLLYANLKGFTLAPDSCADIALRCQLDLDFLMSSKDAQRCENILAARGYSLVGTGARSKEFKADSEQLPSVQDLYRAKPQRSVEVHFVDGDRGDNNPRKSELSRLRSKKWKNSEFPVLSELDKFLGHAQHLFKHLKSEWTRASWILEYSNFIRFHQENHALWLEVQEHLTQNPKIKVAVGAVTLFTEQSFGFSSIPTTLKASIQELSVPVRLWIERYGNDVLMAQFPGTKLYFLLLRALSLDEAGLVSKNSNKIFPVHHPPRITVASGKANLIVQLNQHWQQIRFFCFRLKFHLCQGLVFIIEESRWKKSIALLQM